MGNQIEIALRASVHRVVVTLVQFLPGLVAFLLAIAVLACVGVLLAAVVRRVLTSMRFRRASLRSSAAWRTHESLGMVALQLADAPALARRPLAVSARWFGHRRVRLRRLL